MKTVSGDVVKTEDKLKHYTCSSRLHINDIDECWTNTLMSWRRSFTSFVTGFDTLKLKENETHSGHQNEQLVSTESLTVNCT